jgi:hypothetical protein
MSKLKPRLRREFILRTGWALVGYLLLTLILTWPLAIHFAIAIPGDGFDGWQNYWNLWWMREALLRLQTSPLFTPYLYYPTGASLLFHTLNPFNGFLTLPIQLLASLVIAYNAVVLFSFVVGGFGAYLLALHVLASLGRFTPSAVPRDAHLAAFVAGIIYAFSPFHFAHLLGHMQVFSLEWLPFYTLYLLRALPGAPAGWREKEGTRAGSVARDAAKASFFLVLTGLCDWYYVFFLLLLTGLLVAWLAYSKVRSGVSGRCNRQRQQGETGHVLRSWGRLLAVPVAIFSGFALALSPLLFPMLRQAQEAEYLVPAAEQSQNLSADLLAFFTPARFHPLWGEAARIVSDRFTSPPSEHTVFVGYLPLALALIAIVGLWRCRPVRFWGLSLVTFSVLALGPVLHVAGQTEFLGPGIEVPLPFAILSAILPFVRLTRSLSRFAVMVMLSLAILAALGLQTVITCLPQRHKDTKITSCLRVLVVIIVGALICLEYLAVPYPMTPLDTPPFYQELAHEPGDFAIVALPMNWDRPNPLLYQTVHRRPLISAYTSRHNPLSIVERTPLLQNWRFLGPDIIDADLGVIGISVLNRFNVGYVVLDLWQMPGGAEREETMKITRQVLPALAPAYEDGRFIVYRVPQALDPQPFLALGDGWGEQQHEGSRPFRVMAGDATLKLYGVGKESASLTFELDAPPQVTALKIASPGQGWRRYSLTPGRQELTTGPLSLIAGESLLHLQIEGPADATLVFWKVRLDVMRDG